jgi:hypothetical protein
VYFCCVALLCLTLRLFLMSRSFPVSVELLLLWEILGLFRLTASHSVMNRSLVNSIGTYPSKLNLVLQTSGMDHSNILRISPAVNLSVSLVLLGKSGRLLLSLPTAATVFRIGSSVGICMRCHIHCFRLSNALKGNTI